VKLFVVRHGHAGSRSDWDGPDRLRPLSEKGNRQAQGIAEALAGKGVAQIVSSPATRCVQTVEPLAHAGLDVEEDKRLFEGTHVGEVLQLVEELDGAVPVLCSHGDVIPDLLEALRIRDAKVRGPILWAKGSIWELKIEGGRITRGQYFAPAT
jgi:phosphohistidine phosphatase SixA